jgi:hypothetical protein
MTYSLGQGPLSKGKRLVVAVEESSDGSYLDIIVSNRSGQIAAVSLALTMDGDLTVHANDHTTPHVPDTFDPACVVEREVLVTRALDAKPLEADEGSPLRDQLGRPGLTAGQMAAVLRGEKVMCPACGHGAVSAVEVGGVRYAEHKHPTCDFVQENTTTEVKG